jgi:hypothetical protein
MTDNKNLPLLVHECPSCGKINATRSSLVPSGETGDGQEIVGWLVRIDCAGCALQNMKFKLPDYEPPELSTRPDVLFTYSQDLKLLVRKPRK